MLNLVDNPYRMIAFTLVLLLLSACSAVQTSPTPVPPTPSGGGGHIAFVSQRDGNAEVYIMNVDGTGQTNLTNHQAEDLWPAVSPGGGMVAFISNRDEPDPEGCQKEGVCNYELYVVGIDAAGLARLTNDPGRENWPAWLPDGNKIAFFSAREGQWDIYLIDGDGSNPINLTDDAGLDLYPAGVPGESKVVFLSARDGSFQYWEVGIDGADLTMLDSGLPPREDSEDGMVSVMWTEGHTFFISPGSIFESRPFKDSQASLGEFPAWSPDGTQIAFHSTRDGNREIYVVDSGLSNVRRLTNNEAEDSFPVWSPDGTQIAFQSDRDGNLEIYVMAVDGSNLRNLTNNPAYDALPAWYP